MRQISKILVNIVDQLHESKLTSRHVAEQDNQLSFSLRSSKPSSTFCMWLENAGSFCIQESSGMIIVL